MPFTPEQVAKLKAAPPEVARQALSRLTADERAELMTALKGGGGQAQAQPAQDWEDTQYGFKVRKTVTPDTGIPTVQRETGEVWYGPEQGNKGPAGWFNAQGQMVEDKKTDPIGLMGATVRGAGPYAVAAGLGAAAGAPIGGVGALPGAGAGLAAYGLADLLGDPITMGVNKLMGTNYQLPSEAIQAWFDKMGVAKPDTPAERIVQTGAQAAAGGLGQAQLGKSLVRATGPGLTQDIGAALSANPLQQVVGGGGSGVASQTAAELNADPITQILAGVGGGMAASRIAAPRPIPGSTDRLQMVLGEATSAGVPVMTSDVAPPSTFMGRWAQSMGEKIPIVGTGGQRVSQQKARIKMVEDLVNEYGANVPVDAKDIAGDLLSKRGADLEKYTNLKKGVFSKVAKSGPVGVPNATSEIDNQIKYLNSLGTEQVSGVVSALEDFKGAIQGKDIQQIETLRKLLGEHFKSQDLSAARDVSQKALNSIYRPLNDDISAFIRANGDAKDLVKWKVANARLSEMAGEAQKSSLKRVLKTGDQTPEVVNGLLFSSNPSDVRALYSGLTNEGRANARMAIIAKAAEQAGGAEQLSPEKFRTALKKLGGPIGVFFSGSDLDRVDGVARVLDLTRRAGVAGVTPPTGVQAVPFLAIDALSQTFGGPMGATASAVSLGTMARAYESAPVRNLLMKIPKTAPGSREEAELFKRLQNAVMVETTKKEQK